MSRQFLGLIGRGSATTGKVRNRPQTLYSVYSKQTGVYSIQPRVVFREAYDCVVLSYRTGTRRPDRTALSVFYDSMVFAPAALYEET